MNIIQMNIADIRPYERNPRKNDGAVEYVAASIRTFGFKVPIIVDANGVIVAGHTRYKAAKNLHMETVPCIVADDLTDDQIKAFRLADNKVAEKAEWDFEMLDAEMDELFDWDMSVFGFDDAPDEMAFPDELDAENDAGNVYTMTIRFDDQRAFEQCKNEIESIVENHGGRLSVKME